MDCKRLVCIYNRYSINIYIYIEREREREYLLDPIVDI